MFTRIVKLANSLLMISSSVIRQKGESQNGDDKKTKHANFSEKKKRTFLTPNTHNFGISVLSFEIYLNFLIQFNKASSTSFIAKTLGFNTRHIFTV